MADMVDYYAELGIGKELSLAEIQAELAKLERVWHQREVAQPEKARKILVLIDDAKAVFETEEVRVKYDQDLERSEDGANQDDCNIELRQECGKRLKEAQDFYNDQQFDLAKICVDKALRLAEYSESEADVYAWAAYIYDKNELFLDAMNYINIVISIMPDWYYAYKTKEDILISVIEYQNKCNGDVAKYVISHRKTCEMLAQKSAKFDDFETTAYAMVQLAKSYYFELFGQPDYGMVEKFARQALEYDSNNETAKQMLQEIERPRRVGLNALRQYENEDVPFLKDIEEIVQQIISTCTPQNGDDGWLLATKEHFWYHPDSKDDFDETERVEERFILKPDGVFYIYKKWSNERISNRNPSMHFNDVENTVIKLDTIIHILAEFDFDGEYDKRDKYPIVSTTRIAGIPSEAHGDETHVRLVRRYFRKGQGLYNRLKEIADKAAAYIEECNKINAEYYKELEPMKQEIADKYAGHRKDLESEYEQKKDEAVKNQQKIADLEQQISSMRNELSSLGFFAMKRKKELEAKIQAAYEAMSSIDTVEKVISKYSGLIKELEQKEESEIRGVERALRSKYPLPTQ